MRKCGTSFRVNGREHPRVRTLTQRNLMPPFGLNSQWRNESGSSPVHESLLLVRHWQDLGSRGYPGSHNSEHGFKKSHSDSFTHILDIFLEPCLRSSVAPGPRNRLIRRSAHRKRSIQRISWWSFSLSMSTTGVESGLGRIVAPYVEGLVEDVRVTGAVYAPAIIVTRNRVTTWP